ncbi:MAG TPA: sulfotransferase [Rhizomicrobium sp.]|jgi:tetratricopeptide (TPR) repeat protein
MGRPYAKHFIARADSRKVWWEMSGETTAQNPRLDSLVRQAVSHLERRELQQSDAVLSAILAESPAHAQALQLLGIVRRSQNRFAEAEDLYRRSLIANPDQPQVHHNLGNLLKASNRLEDAIAQQREAIRLKPNFAEAHLALALALSALGDHISAEKSCRDALRPQPNYAAAKLALAAELCALNRPQEAERIIRQTLRVGVREPQLTAAFEYNLGMALKQQRKFDEALAQFDRAQAIIPNLPEADYSRANTLQQMGHLEPASAAYHKALALNPDHIESLACLALVSAQLGDFATTKSAAEKACLLDTMHPLAQIALAIAEIEDGAFAVALRRLQRLLDDDRFAGDGQTSFAAGFAADAFDRHDRIAEAFSTFAISNDVQRRIYAPEFGPNRVVDDVGRLTTYFRKSETWTASPKPPKPENPAGHVFVLGFMRSGTTLLETVLSTNPNVVHIDEIEFLTEAARAFLLHDSDLDRLKSLEDSEALKWRDAYWDSVRKAGLSVDGKIFVDKMPFNTLRLPLIARLFPSAKIIFAIRDPRDVVLSCFRRRFNPSPFSYEFFRLEDCARFYSETMSLASLYREKLPLTLREHRYEDMVADFAGSVRPLCDFIGLEWNETMQDFRSAANAIDRRSPSAAQVSRGLYAEAAGQWRRYREQLAPVLPILAPWVARFGYPAD